jgi:hypothetical protein
MHDAPADATPRDVAVACARRIFYRPEPIVDALVASFCDLAAEHYPGDAAVAHACYERPIRMGATRAVFALRALHWPMLNLLDAADRDRRNFADAMAAAVSAARERAA